MQKYKNYTSFIVIVCVMISFTPSFASMIKKDDINVLFISESHGASGSRTLWKSSKNFMGRKVDGSFALGNGNLSQTRFDSSKQALTVVKNAITPFITEYQRRVVTFLKNNGYSYARVDWFYVFTDVSDGNTQKKVYLPMIIYVDGNVRNIGWRVLSSSIKILYYIYKSKSAEGIPSNWAYPDGGVLYKYVLDENLSLLSQSSVDINGRYDPPTIPEGESELDPDSGLKLLISEVAVPEMNEKGAIFSIIDYARSITPVYNCDSNGNCVAAVNVESTLREFAKYGQNNSKVCYKNNGKIGYKLEYTNERYIVQSSGVYTLTAQSVGVAVSPTIEFSKKVVDIEWIPNYKTIIDPFNTSTLYNFDNDTVNNLPCSSYIFSGNTCAQAPLAEKTPSGNFLSGKVPFDKISPFINYVEGDGNALYFKLCYIACNEYDCHPFCHNRGTIYADGVTFSGSAGYKLIQEPFWHNIITIVGNGNKIDIYNYNYDTWDGSYTGSIHVSGATVSGVIGGVRGADIYQIVASGNQLTGYSYHSNPIYLGTITFNNASGSCPL